MNSYLLESEDSLSLQTERDNIIHENHFEDAVINTYDMEEVPLENALEDLDTYGFLSDKKVIVIENIEVLKYDDFKKDFDHLFLYIKNPNPDNLLILESNKLNNTLKVTKELKKICKYIEISIDIKSYMKVKQNVNLFNKKVLIVDDVYTTGSTIDAAINLIKGLRPKKIKVLVMSKTINENYKQTHKV